MKALLALTIILGGVLITSNSHAVLTQQSIVTGPQTLQVSGPAINPAAHIGNIADCPLHHQGAEKNGNSFSSLDSAKNSLRTH